MRSDRIGKIGERKFDDLVHPDVTVNSSKEDEQGWDKIVEFPFVSNVNKAFDETRTHRKFFIQVKTVKSHRKKIKLTLSSAEKIARNELPSGIFVFQLARSEKWSGKLYYIEFIGNPLERVLTRLRKASADGNAELNKLYITFDFEKEGQRVPITDFPVSDYLDTLISNHVQYIKDKTLFMEAAGYSERRFVVSFENSEVGDQEDWNLFLLGEKGLKPTSIVETDIRFGVAVSKIVDVKNRNTEVRVKPDSNPDFTFLEASSIDFNQSVSIQGNFRHLHFAAQPDAEFPPFVFETPAFKIKYGFPSGTAQIETIYFNEDKMLSPSEIMNTGLLMLILSQEDFELKIRDKYSVNEIKFEAMTPLNYDNDFDLKYTWFYGHALKELCHKADMQDFCFSFEELKLNNIGLLTLFKFTGMNLPDIKLRYNKTKFDMSQLPTPGKMISRVKIKDLYFALCSDVSKFYLSEDEYLCADGNDISLEEVVILPDYEIFRHKHEEVFAKMSKKHNEGSEEILIINLDAHYLLSK